MPSAADELPSDVHVAALLLVALCVIPLAARAQDAPLRWTDSTARPTGDVDVALALLADATLDGLDTRDYQLDTLQQRAADLRGATQPDARAAADFDEAMSRAMLRFVTHIHLGRIDPRTLGLRLVVPAEPHDLEALLRTALHTGTLRETVTALRPTLVQYQLTRAALARYRQLAATSPAAPVPDTRQRPGPSVDAGLALTQRLRLLGDLATDGATAASTDAPADAATLAAAVQHFQERHGLAPDGVVGAATRAALDVPLPWRVRQLEMALERLRWLPDLHERRVIALNIPMFEFWGWDGPTPSGLPSLRMRAVVGRALSSRTPVFVDEMDHVIFRPYWNVPRSIVLSEVLPALARDPSYLRSHAMELVRGASDAGAVVPESPEAIAQLRSGALRLRQRPGPTNALGLAKFMFPNDDAVYMHGTPAYSLFSRTRRDFSHGCVRVEYPALLAEWVLRDEPGWTTDRILDAMHGSAPQRVDLREPIQVVLFYSTAGVRPTDGAVRFADDIYGHDVRLDRALRAASEARTQER